MENLWLKHNILSNGIDLMDLVYLYETNESNLFFPRSETFKMNSGQQSLIGCLSTNFVV